MTEFDCSRADKFLPGWFALKSDSVMIELVSSFYSFISSLGSSSQIISKLTIVSISKKFNEKNVFFSFSERYCIRLALYPELHMLSNSNLNSVVFSSSQLLF